MFISSLTCRKSNFQNNKIDTINKISRSACDSLGFYFIKKIIITRYHLASHGICLNYGGTDMLCENISFCLTTFHDVREAKLMNHLINLIQQNTLILAVRKRIFVTQWDI